MCRNIKTLFNFEPPATEDEIRAASLQFVRKLSGFHKPSKANEAAFEAAVDETAAVAHTLLASLTRGLPLRILGHTAGRQALRTSHGRPLIRYPRACEG